MARIILDGFESKDEAIAFYGRLSSTLGEGSGTHLDNGKTRIYPGLKFTTTYDGDVTGTVQRHEKQYPKDTEAPPTKERPRGNPPVPGVLGTTPPASQTPGIKGNTPAS